MKRPHNRDVSPPPGTRPPEYVVEMWVSKQLRDRIGRNGISLAEALQTPDKLATAPQPDLEAEP